jgi:hypothetical protein
MSKNSKKEEELLDESFAIEAEIIEKLHFLVGASWDSNTLKAEIENLLKAYERVSEELDKLPHEEH